MKLSAGDITIFLVGIAVMLFFARSFGELIKKFKQPIVIGEIIAGIILGPTILGSIFPDFFHNLFVRSENIVIAHEGITTLAVVMLMLVSGLEIDLGMLLKQGRAALSTSLLGITFPFALGFLSAYFFPEFMGIKEESMRLVFALFIGTALSITALPVVAKTLMDLNILKSEIGFLIIASAMLNDLVGWIIFSLILSNLGTTGHGMPFIQITLIIFFFILFFLLIGRKIFNKLIEVIQKRMAFPGGVLNFVLISGFLGAAFTEFIGIHAIFGAFIIGISIGDSVQLKEQTREIIHQFVTNIFAPIFFVSIGLRVNFIEHFDPLIVLIFLILAFAGKVIGCGLGARWGGLTSDDSLAVGFGMNSRGAMEIVLGILALQFGLIRETVFVALVIMALVTSISSAPLMNIFIKKSPRFISFSNLINKKLILLTNFTNKKDLITELVRKTAEVAKVDFQTVFAKVWERELNMPTGIQNYLAIPHARVKIKKPLAVIAVNKTGLDFSAPDDQPSKIFVLLLTPTEENEMQLKLLAQIAGKFSNRSFAEEILQANDKEMIMSLINR